MGKILIIADIDSKCFATPRGLELAARLGHSAEVVAFTHASLKSLKVKAAEQERVRKQLLAKREEAVQARIDQYQRPGQKVSLKVVWDTNVAGWVNKRCGSHDYFAVVKTGHRSESLVHTSLDWQLLRDCPAPVLIVAENKWHRTRPVLATLDLGTTSAAKRKLNDKVLATARHLADTLEVQLEVITAVAVPTLLADLDLVDPAAFARQEVAKMQPYIARLAKAHDLPETAFHCKRGPVEKVITSRAAKVRAQIVVMGTVGRKGVKARLLGNTAERVLSRLRTDVMALKP